MPTDKYGQGVSYLDYSEQPDLFLMGQRLADGLAGLSVMRFPDAFTRDDTITTPVAGMLTWIADSSRFEFYDGTAWQSTEPPHVQTTNPAVNLATATTTYTALNLGTVLTSNRSDMFDPVHPTRLIAPTPGTYATTGFLVWQGTLGTAEGRAEWRLNGSGVQAPAARFNIARGSGGNAPAVASGVLVFPSAGYAEVYANQNSGGTTTLTTAIGMYRISTST